jgi:aminoglycoside phosphotransferase (APT) family kinase protein
MLTELVPHVEADDVPPGAHAELGRLARRIHAIEPTGSDLDRLSRPEPWGQWILARLLRRVEAARRYMPMPPAAEVERALAAALRARTARARALLHLDLRAPNLAMRSDSIVSILDLGNAIVGDRYLELARLRGCGLLTPAFLSGYGESPAELRRNAPALDAYELDLAALLVVVSREEFDDERLHRKMVERVAALLARLTARGSTG